MPETLQKVTMVCRMCDSQMWEFLWVIFDDEGVVSAYSDQMRCHCCGLLTESPMPGVNM